jgi:hypothetical protein
LLDYDIFSSLEQSVVDGIGMVTVTIAAFEGRWQWIVTASLVLEAYVDLIISTLL